MHAPALFSPPVVPQQSSINQSARTSRLSSGSKCGAERLPFPLSLSLTLTLSSSSTTLSDCLVPPLLFICSTFYHRTNSKQRPFLPPSGANSLPKVCVCARTKISTRCVRKRQSKLSVCVCVCVWRYLTKQVSTCVTHAHTEGATSFRVRSELRKGAGLEPTWFLPSPNV